MSHVEREPESVSDPRPETPIAIRRVLEKMMAKNKEDRYQTPAEVAETLDGPVKIEINDPKIKVRFGDKMLTFENAGEEITIKPGVHSLFVERGDLKFTTPKLTLGRGENPALQVEFLAGKLVVKQGETELAKRSVSGLNGFIASQTKDKSTLRDELAFEGEWLPISVNQNGQSIPTQVLKKSQFPTKFIFKKKHWGAISPDGKRYESSLILDATKSPKWIDVKGSLFEGMPNYHGIYNIEGDIATMCLVQRNQPRPTAFTTKGKPGAMLIVARRRGGAVKPPPPRPGDKLEAKYRQTINKGLKYLVKTQHADGYWEGNGGNYCVSMTALAGMALLMEGSTVHEGPYAESIRKAVAWLTAQSQPDGRLVYMKAKSNTRYMFGHGYAMLFLATVYGPEEDLKRRRALKKVLTKAVQFTAAARTTRGGWGYKHAKEGNDFDECATSITQLQALRAARNAGILVPRGLIDAEYLRKFTGPTGGVLYSLNKTSISERPGLTAAALAGCEYDSELFKKWFKFCQKKIPLNNARTALDEYVHYYYAQAMYILGNTGYAKLFPKSNPADRLTWSKYRTAIFDDLVARQLADGSWTTKGWAVGPVYSTAIWTTIMQLDNGVVPIYQRSPGSKKTPSQKD